MNHAPLQKDPTLAKMLDETAAYIASVQSLDGNLTLGAYQSLIDRFLKNEIQTEKLVSCG